LSPQRKKELTFSALLRQIERLSQQQPVLIVFEDIHWIDPSSRELLDRIIEQVADWPVLLLATFRPEFQPPWAGSPHLAMLNLARLDRHDAAAMVENLAGNALSSAAVEEIAERADGVPLFVEELTKAVLESGTQGVSILSAVPQPGLSVPATLHASLMSRLDRLGPVAKDIAQKGAALGRDFSYELLVSVADLPDPRLREALDRLAGSGLILARGTPPQSTYLFKHALLQDAGYGTLLRSRRQQLHARTAAILEERFPDITAAQPELLAHHCEQAGLIRNAAGYLLAAGPQALARSAMKEADTLLRKGLDMLAGLPDESWRGQQELEMLIALGSALTATKGFAADEVGATLARARALAERIGGREHLGPLTVNQWIFHYARSELRVALSLAEQMEKIGEERNDVAAQLQGRDFRGLACCFLGQFPAARELLERCHTLSDPAHRAAASAGLALQDLYVAMLAHLAITLAQLGLIAQAQARLHGALAEARRRGHANTLAHVLAWAAWVSWITRSPELQGQTEELLALSARHGFSLWSARATVAQDACCSGSGKRGRAWRTSSGGWRRCVRPEPFPGPRGCSFRSPRPTACSGSRSKGCAASTRLGKSSRRPKSGSTSRSCIGCGATCCCKPAMVPRPRAASAKRSRSPKARARSSMSCALRPALPGSGATTAKRARRAPCSHRSTAGSPRVSRRPIFRTPGHCWPNYGGATADPHAMKMPTLCAVASCSPPPGASRRPPPSRGRLIPVRPKSSLPP
jgi:hypothetical protein